MSAPRRHQTAIRGRALFPFPGRRRSRFAHDAPETSPFRDVGQAKQRDRLPKDNATAKAAPGSIESFAGPGQLRKGRIVPVRFRLNARATSSGRWFHVFAYPVSDGGANQSNGVGDFDALDRADESGSLSHSYLVHRSRSPGNAPVRRPAPAIGPEFPGWAVRRVFAVRGQSWNLHQRIIMSSWVSPRSVSMDHTLQRIRIFGFDWSLLSLSRGFGISRLHEFKKRLTSKA